MGGILITIARRSFGLLVFMAGWEIVSATGLVSPDYMPRVATIGAALFDFLGSGKFWLSFGITLHRMLVGLAVAVVLALGLAVVAARFPLLRRALEPTTDILRSLPPPALVPLLIFVLGIGPGLFYSIVIFGCMWATYVSASNALATAEPVQLQTARSLGLTPWQIMWQVRLPAAAPEIFTGIRLSAAISLLATVATEMLVGGEGLGSLIYNAGFSLLWDQMYALMVVIGALGVALNIGVALVRRPLAGWQTRLSAMGAQS
ncbi:MAG: ABC transporter permease subunit [Maritimibacter sp.]|nr:ABC transporter permease subunit [Maritimibacter sp.]